MRSARSKAKPASLEPEPPPRTVPLYGVDTMLFVYHFEANAEFGASAAQILTAAEDGRCRLVTSILSLTEVLVIPKRRQQGDLCQRYRDFFQSFPNLEVHPIDAQIAEAASDLRAEYNIRTPDALHLATALTAGAEVFLTQDRRLKDLPDLPVRRFHTLSL